MKLKKQRRKRKKMDRTFKSKQGKKVRRWVLRLKKKRNRSENQRN